MQRSITCLSALALLAVAGCNAAPLAPDATPGRRMLTGYTYGSGNAVGTTPPGQTTTAPAPAVAVESDTTSRGGYTYGSGN